jgi:uncharacterized DUF497 family protein
MRMCMLAVVALASARSAVATRFEWDEEKASQNLRKHALSFEEASGLFTSGVDYLEIFDGDHSDEEERFICIGPIARGIVLVGITDVDTDLIRIISARVATRREALLYGQFLEERSDA